jgi:hypothetical protein
VEWQRCFHLVRLLLEEGGGLPTEPGLMVGGVAVILGLFDDVVVPGGYQGAVDDEDGVLREPLAWPQCELRSEVVNHSVDGRLRHSEQRRQLPQCQVRAPVRSNKHPVGKRQLPRSAPAQRTSALPTHLGNQTNLPKVRRHSPVNGAIQDGSDAVITPVTTKIMT